MERNLVFLPSLLVGLTLLSTVFSATIPDPCTWDADCAIDSFDIITISSPSPYPDNITAQRVTYTFSAASINTITVEFKDGSQTDGDNDYLRFYDTNGQVAEKKGDSSNFTSFTVDGTTSIDFEFTSDGASGVNSFEFVVIPGIKTSAQGVNVIETPVHFDFSSDEPYEDTVDFTKSVTFPHLAEVSFQTATKIEATFDVLWFENSDGDILSRFSGNDSNLAASFWVYESPLVVRFSSDGSGSSDGFDFRVTFVEKCSWKTGCTVDSNELQLIESLHPYSNDLASNVLTYSFTAANVSKIVIQFMASSRTSDSNDYLKFLDLSDTELGSYSGDSSNFVDFVIEGTGFKTDFVTNDSGYDYGFTYVTTPLIQETVDGVDFHIGLNYAIIEVDSSYSSDLNLNKVITFTEENAPRLYVSFEGSPTTEASNDYIEFLDSSGVRVAQYSGASENFIPFYIDDNSFTFKFVTNSSINSGGFKIHISNAKTPSWNAGFATHDIKEFQIISPSPYPADVSQRQKYTFAHSQVSKINIMWNGLQETFDENDYVNIYDAEGTQQAHFYGPSHQFLPLTLEGNSFELEFVSDSSNSGRGISLTAIPIVDGYDQWEDYEQSPWKRESQITWKSNSGTATILPMLPNLNTKVTTELVPPSVGIEWTFAAPDGTVLRAEAQDSSSVLIEFASPYEVSYTSDSAVSSKIIYEITESQCDWNVGCSIYQEKSVDITVPGSYPPDQSSRVTYKYLTEGVTSIVISFADGAATDSDQDVLKFYDSRGTLVSSFSETNFSDVTIMDNIFDFEFISDGSGASASGVTFTITPVGSCSWAQDCQTDSLGPLVYSLTMAEDATIAMEITHQNADVGGFVVSFDGTISPAGFLRALDGDDNVIMNLTGEARVLVEEEEGSSGGGGDTPVSKSGTGYFQGGRAIKIQADLSTSNEINLILYPLGSSCSWSASCLIDEADNYTVKFPTTFPRAEEYASFYVFSSSMVSKVHGEVSREGGSDFDPDMVLSFDDDSTVEGASSTLTTPFEKTGKWFSLKSEVTQTGAISGDVSLTFWPEGPCWWKSGCEVTTIESQTITYPSPYPDSQSTDLTYLFSDAAVTGVRVIFDDVTALDSGDTLKFYDAGDVLQLTVDSSSGDLITPTEITGKTVRVEFESDANSGPGQISFVLSPISPCDWNVSCALIELEPLKITSGGAYGTSQATEAVYSFDAEGITGIDIEFDASTTINANDYLKFLDDDDNEIASLTSGDTLTTGASVPGKVVKFKFESDAVDESGEFTFTLYPTGVQWWALDATTADVEPLLVTSDGAYPDGIMRTVTYSFTNADITGAEVVFDDSYTTLNANDSIAFTETDGTAIGSPLTNGSTLTTPISIPDKTFKMTFTSDNVSESGQFKFVIYPTGVQWWALDATTSEVEPLVVTSDGAYPDGITRSATYSFTNADVTGAEVVFDDSYTTLNANDSITFTETDGTAIGSPLTNSSTLTTPITIPDKTFKMTFTSDDVSENGQFRFIVYPTGPCWWGSGCEVSTLDPVSLSSPATLDVNRRVTFTFSASDVATLDVEFGDNSQSDGADDSLVFYYGADQSKTFSGASPFEDFTIQGAEVEIEFATDGTADTNNYSFQIIPRVLSAEETSEEATEESTEETAEADPQEEESANEGSESSGTQEEEGESTNEGSESSGEQEEEESQQTEEQSESDEEGEENEDETCDSHSDCPRLTPYCNSSLEKAQCVACNDEGNTAQQGTFDHICAEVDAQKTVCNTEGYCTKDLSAEVSAAEDLATEVQNLTITQVLDQVGDLIDDSLTDLPSEESRTVVDSLTDAVESSLTKTLSISELESVATTMNTLSSSSDHFTAPATTKAIGNTLTLLEKIESSNGTPSDTLPTTVLQTLSHSVDAAENISDVESKSQNFERVDTAVIMTSELLRKGISALNEKKEVKTDQISLTVTRKATTNLLRDVALVDAPEIYVEFPASIDSQLEPACSSGEVDVELFVSSYNSHQDEFGISSKFDITVYCSGTDEEVEIANLTEEIVFAPPMPSTEERNGRAVTDYECVFWKEVDEIWSNDECSTRIDENDAEKLLCGCNHLTTFSLRVDTGEGDDDDDDDFPVWAIVLIIVGILVPIIAIVLVLIVRNGNKKKVTENKTLPEVTDESAMMHTKNIEVEDIQSQSSSSLTRLSSFRCVFCDDSYPIEY